MGEKGRKKGIGEVDSEAMKVGCAVDADAEDSELRKKSTTGPYVGEEGDRTMEK